METFLYSIVYFIADIHSRIMSWNDTNTRVMTDKQLHFWVIGILGMLMLFVVYPLFKLLSKNHILVVAWIYVFTLMVVITFAIEIGQGFTGTGLMEFDDIVFGLVGFMFLFLIFVIIRFIFLAIIGAFKKRSKHKR